MSPLLIKRNHDDPTFALVATGRFQPSRRDALRARSRIKDGVRRWFLDQGFDEVETPILQVSGGNETHIAGFAYRVHRRPDGRMVSLALHSSPEFACKKLLVAGLTRLFTLTPVFRNSERGRSPSSRIHDARMVSATGA